MSNLWDDVKKSLGDWVTKAADRASEFTREAADKAEEVTRLGKVKLDIFQIKRDIEKQFSELGGTVYQLLKKGQAKEIETNARVQVSIEKVDQLEKKLKEKEKRYREIQAAEKEAKKKQAAPTPEQPPVEEQPPKAEKPKKARKSKKSSK